MTNDERGKKSEARMTKYSEVYDRWFRHSDFVIPSNFVIRHSSGGLILSSRTKNAQRWAASSIILLVGLPAP